MTDSEWGCVGLVSALLYGWGSIAFAANDYVNPDRQATAIGVHHWSWPFGVTSANNERHLTAPPGLHTHGTPAPPHPSCGQASAGWSSHSQRAPLQFGQRAARIPANSSGVNVRRFRQLLGTERAHEWISVARRAKGHGAILANGVKGPSRLGPPLSACDGRRRELGGPRVVLSVYINRGFSHEGRKAPHHQMAQLARH